MKINWQWLMEQVNEAENVPGMIAIPLIEFDIEDLTKLADVARKKGLEIRVWSEHSNFSQQTLVEIQRFKDRYLDALKPRITYKI